MKKHLNIAYILLILTAVFSIVSCSVRRDVISDNTPIRRDGFFLDTIVSISIYGENPKDAGEAIDECFTLAKHYENMLSATIETSDIAKINSSAPDAVTVSDDTLEVLKKGMEYGRISEGKFDITMGLVTGMWDFRSGEAVLPDLQKLNEVSSYVNYQKIQIKGNEIRLTEPNVSIDLGGIAKGFIADKMKEKLTDLGITSAFINLGGNVLVIGTKPDGSPIRVGIQDPNNEEGAPIITLEDTENLSIVTSGTYQRYFEIDGVRYHHILSTDDGMPVNNDLASVTIISDSSCDCDALSTTCFILGEERAKDLLMNFNGIKAIFVYNNGEISKFGLD